MQTQLSCVKLGSSSELIGILAKRGIKIHKVTLYRELDFLVDKQVIEVVNLDDGLQRFEYVDRPHHHHLVCIQCREVQDVEDDEDVTRLESLVKRKIKFTVLRHTLEFFGLCQNCQAAKP